LTKALVFLPSFVLLFSVIIPIPFYLFATTRFAVSHSFSSHAFHQREKSYVLVINCCSGRRIRIHEILGVVWIGGFSKEIRRNRKTEEMK